TMRLSTTAISTLSLHDALPIFFIRCRRCDQLRAYPAVKRPVACGLLFSGKRIDPDGSDDGIGSAAVSARRHAISFFEKNRSGNRSEEHTSELQSRENLVCRLRL